jgi:adenylyl-sulfate kinase
MPANNPLGSEGTISRRQRWERNGHAGCVVWLTGLSGSGKSTIACALERALFAANCRPVVLDGDVLRHGLSSNLGFSPEDRAENIRRATETARLLAAIGNVAIVALISPYRLQRQLAREAALADDCAFVEVFVDAPLALCEQRDPKHLYRRARAGEIPDFTGIGAPYENPENPDIRIRTGEMDVDACVGVILEWLMPRLRLDP